MQLHQLKPVHKPKKRVRIGRGGKRGTYSGRGLKGQNARSGRKFKPFVRELIKRYPKLRGARLEMNRKGLRLRPVSLNVSVLDKKFQAGEKVTPLILLEKKLIRRIKGEVPKVKILGKGELTKALEFHSLSYSKSAKEKIQKSGSKINEMAG